MILFRPHNKAMAASLRSFVTHWFTLWIRVGQKDDSTRNFRSQLCQCATHWIGAGRKVHPD
jgi:hypothetical protein